MRTLSVIRADLQARDTELQGLLSIEDGALSAEQLQRMAALTEEINQLGLEREQAEAEARRATDIRSAAQAASQALGTVERRIHPGGAAEDAALRQSTQRPGGAGSAVLPADFRRARVKNFKADKHTGLTEQEVAYQFGMWFLATCGRQPGARDYCRAQGIPLIVVDDKGRQFAHSEVVNSQGGFLVPSPLENQLIDLRETYGVFRMRARNRRMTSDTLAIPRRTGGLTAYSMTDNTAITESTKSWDRVNLTAKKFGVLAKYSSELSEDAVIDMADDLAGEIAYAFAQKEDDCGFNGDGSSTYHGIIGVRAALTNLSGTIANIAGLYVGTGNTYAELTLADFNNTKAKLPLYARQQPDVAWYVHQTFFDGVMERLALAAGGVTEAMIVNGISQQRFLGYPVVASQVMPSVEGNSQVCALLGSLSLAAAFGDRRQTTIAMSEHLNFAEDEMAIRGTERFDIVVHDVGNASATASARVPGPVVGLITAAA